jgi:hypothetical protein
MRIYFLLFGRIAARAAAPFHASAVHFEWRCGIGKWLAFARKGI